MRFICPQLFCLRFSTPPVSHNPPLSPVPTGAGSVMCCGFLPLFFSLCYITDTCVFSRHARARLSVLLDCLSFARPFPSPRQHALPPPLTHKDISCRGSLAPFSCRRVFPLLSCYVCDVICVISNKPCDLIYVMLLLYFRPVKEKKTLLLRNHSICSDPQRFTFVLKVLIIWFYQLTLQTALLELSHIVRL